MSHQINKEKLQAILDSGGSPVFSTKFNGDLQVLEVKDSRNVLVEFLSTGYQRLTSVKHIDLGNVKDPFFPRSCGVGYIGGTKYTIKKDNVAYSKWIGMIKRCYSGNPVHKSYRDCTVCDEWHNFQNFAKWHYENYPKDGKKYSLDKDFKTKGNREYSPDKCQYMTKEENLSFNRNNIDYLIKNKRTREVRVIRYLSEFCREVNIKLKNLSSMLHGKSKSTGEWYLLSDNVIMLFNEKPK